MAMPQFIVLLPKSQLGLWIVQRGGNVRRDMSEEREETHDGDECLEQEPDSIDKYTETPERPSGGRKGFSE